MLVQENHGPAAARNTGVAAASGRWVAFLGDDTVPSPGWLAAHREAHRRRGDDPHLGVIGYTGWHRRMRLNPFLRYINEHGLQFGYALIHDKEDVPFNFLYTSNLSLPRDLLLAEPFDLRFPHAAWEDIEVGYRLKKRGFRLVYEPAATVAHDHPTDLAAVRGAAGEGGLLRGGVLPAAPGARLLSRSRSRRAAATAAGGAAEAQGTAGPGLAKLAGEHPQAVGRCAPVSLHQRSSPRLV